MNGDSCKEGPSVEVSYLPAGKCGVSIPCDMRTEEHSAVAHHNFEPVLSAQRAFRELVIHADGNSLTLVQLTGQEPVATCVQTVSKAAVVWKRCLIQQV